MAKNKGLMAQLPEWATAEQTAKIKKLKKAGKLNKANKLMDKINAGGPATPANTPLPERGGSGAGGQINVGPPVGEDAYKVDPISKEGINLISQPINEQIINTLGQVRDATANPFNLDGISAAPSMQDFAGERQRIEDDLYNRNKTRIDDDFNQRREQMSQSLANKGIPIGSELYQKEMDRFDQNYQDSLGDARGQAMQAGTAEQQRLYNNAWQSRQNQINERLGVRGQALNELGAYQPWYGYQAGLYGQEAGFDQQDKMSDKQFGQSQQLAEQQFGYNTKLADQQAKNQIKVANQVPRGGGGGGGYDPFALANLNHQNSLERMQMDQAFQMMMQGAPQQGNSKGQQMANGAAAGFGSGVGSAMA